LQVSIPCTFFCLCFDREARATLWSVTHSAHANWSQNYLVELIKILSGDNTSSERELPIIGSIFYLASPCALFACAAAARIKNCSRHTKGLLDWRRTQTKSKRTQTHFQWCATRAQPRSLISRRPPLSVLLREIKFLLQQHTHASCAQ
jgi:hypothetical protein